MIIGISGPAGAGKDTAAEYIESKFNLTHVSGGDVLREMLSAFGFEPKKQAVSELGTLLRINYGADAILRLVVQKGGSANIINSGFRSPEEAKLIKDSGGVVVFIDAPQALRHERVIARARADDTLTSLEAMDAKEAKSSNPLAESLEDLKDLADFIIINDGAIEELYAKLDAIFTDLLAQPSA